MFLKTKVPQKRSDLNHTINQDNPKAQDEIKTLEAHHICIVNDSQFKSKHTNTEKR